MNREFELDSDGNVVDRMTFGDVMAAMNKSPYKKFREAVELITAKNGVLFIDMSDVGCYRCPCCDGEQAFCTVLDGGPECKYGERLPNCPIKVITITPEVFAERMRNIQELYSDRHDTEERHMAMDDLMCELLRELGYSEGIDIFENAHKWYA